MTYPKVLIVDDDEGMRNQLKWGFEGYDVIMANSRLHAIEQFNIHHPPLVTLDLGMPPDVEGTTEGFATLKAILKAAPKTRVIVISGSNDNANANIAKEEGAFEYCSKPVELESLQKILQQAFIDYQSS